MPGTNYSGYSRAILGLDSQMALLWADFFLDWVVVCVRGSCEDANTQIRAVS